MPSPRYRHAAPAAALAAAALCGALYAQSLNLRPGLYEVVSASQVTLTAQMQKALPPGYLEKLQQPHTSQQCISETDLKNVGKQLTEERGNNDASDASCKLINSSVAGEKVKFDLQCRRSTSHFEGSFSGTSFQAQVDEQTDHGPMKIKLTGRRLGNCAK